MARVVFDQIEKVFEDEKKGTFKAVSNSSFVIEDKEFVVFVGPSGCGKTTSLRMIAGLERQTSGDIYIGDRLVNTLHPKDRDIAMVFQDYALYPHMTIRENLSFGLKNLKRPKAEIEAKVKQASEILGLEDLLDRKPKELSGGQRQRVAVGRAIVRDPQVFLFDEPLSNLDAKLRVQMRVELAELHKRLGATIVFVTHDQVEAMTLGERIVVMNKGEIQQIASPTELYNKPNNMFVAGFMGSPAMNFIDARIEGNKLTIEGTEFILADPMAKALAAYQNKPVILGIRPEHIYGEDFSQHVSKDNKIRAIISVIENLGGENLVYFKIGNRMITARLHPEASVSVGENKPFVFDSSKLHFFDPETEARIVW
ncbi:sn-glycerol-3-phosphate ABC transporter ATP-binding protein UgpC [Paenibacillus larvae]|nr:sn-glycerol-3-phosphate ABC transporter ATP-binding protein UgpC [Paenibacillus larvae]AQR78991.1 ABC transporter ATP-binding protein [Paenibacillus larvae subsp. larvae]ARF68649.1 ABC transporter ATP-binding protein [Paenibacillus larvae subsp. pulvifaciens]AVF23928.1 maltodextrin import ATP-binding protein MsmX [Paenibacillus larvae subsp. larvae]AVG10802.1 maltodextrin import ATP-binding protein MsmX [Paenibacillus larvae subsp. larvae DSM 25430]ETK29398.1 maltodextrin import ATP-binding